ncbi:hypothetical protein BRARA_C03852 [Brassica rapa]|uniref:APO domain-containing protein n=1 Tax=Brassica campestris TaxID=3711 RepID=A0A398A2A7_BRACM|nr:hypothetical protein BRARA_C03852 [Brassica rapa]
MGCLPILLFELIKIFSSLASTPNNMTSLALVIWRHKVWRHFQVACYSSTPSRTNKSMANKLRRIQPMIQRRIENRAKDYPIQEIVPLDKEVLKARRSLLTNVTLLLKVFPVLTCKFCSEVFIGKEEHLIQTCCSYIRVENNKLHEYYGVGRVNEGINYYGHASAVASLCSHASALVSNTKYACEMKPRGLSFPFSNSSPYQET